MKYRYDVINRKTKKQESWTGIFNNQKEADRWYEVHGKDWEKKGFKFVLVECGNTLRRDT